MTTLAQLEEGIRLTKIATEREVAGAALHIPAAVDVLIQLPRFARADRSVQGEQPFRSWAVSVYVNAAHTSWALYDPWRSGLYHESTIPLRNLTESLVQLRYFETRMGDVLQLLLRHFPRHLPGYASAVDPGLEARRVAEVAWLQSAFDAQVAQFPRSTDWAGLVRPLVEVEAPPASTPS